MKKILLALVLVLSGLLLVGVAAAQESPEEIAKRHGITFPISELGNCASYAECRTHCEDPVHHKTCVAFAKEKGFYREKEFEVSQNILKRAETALGCTSIDSCRSFCEKSENFDRCHSFSQSVGLAGGYTHDPTSGDFLNRASQVLGCDSYESCRSFCDNPVSRDRCAEFARTIDARGGYEYRGPGGCTSEKTCTAFCSSPSNIEICKQFAGAHGASFTGPGGCSDDASCRAYCEKNPQACGGFQGESNPEEMCRRTPSCQWSGNTCQCGLSEGVDRNYDPAAECSKHGCNWTGSYCQCGSTQDYQEKWKSECEKYSGCSWTGSSCQCTPSGGQYTPHPTSEGSYTPASGYDPATECAKQAGCSWTGSSCQCTSTGESSGSTPSPESYSQPSSEGTYDPATECAKYPGCSWSDSSCQCSSVQGTATSVAPGFWQKFFNLLGL